MSPSRPPTGLLGPPESPFVTADRAARAAHRQALAHRLTPALTRVAVRQAFRDAYQVASEARGITHQPSPLTGDYRLDVAS